MLFSLVMLMDGPRASVSDGTQERTACNRARQVRMSSFGRSQVEGEESV